MICIKNSDVRNDVGNYMRNNIRKHEVKSRRNRNAAGNGIENDVIPCVVS